jgi:hypothetical protein
LDWGNETGQQRRRGVPKHLESCFKIAEPFPKGWSFSCVSLDSVDEGAAASPEKGRVQVPFSY